MQHAKDLQIYLRVTEYKSREKWACPRWLGGGYTDKSVRALALTSSGSGFRLRASPVLRMRPLAGSVSIQDIQP